MLVYRCARLVYRCGWAGVLVWLSWCSYAGVQVCWAGVLVWLCSIFSITSGGEAMYQSCNGPCSSHSLSRVLTPAKSTLSSWHSTPTWLSSILSCWHLISSSYNPRSPADIPHSPGYNPHWTGYHTPSPADIPQYPVVIHALVVTTIILLLTSVLTWLHMHVCTWTAYNPHDHSYTPSFHSVHPHDHCGNPHCPA
jgi:hypothetical protein